MQDIGHAGGSVRRDTDRYRTDIAVAVSMAIPAGQDFERLLGAERASPAAGPERTAAEDLAASDTARRPDATSRQDAPRDEAGTVRTEGRHGRDVRTTSESAETDESDTARGRIDRRMASGVTAARIAASGMDLPARALKLATAVDAAATNVSDYARLLEQVRGTLKTVNGAEPPEPDAQGRSRLQGVCHGAESTDGIKAADPAGTGEFNPASVLIEGLSDVGTAPAKAQTTPAPAADPAPVPEAEIRAQVVAQLTGKLGALGGKGTLKIELTPPELGRVEIRFTREGDRLHLLFRVESAAAARALQDGSGHLQELLLGRNGHWSQIEVCVVREDETAAGRRERRQDDRDDPGREDGPGEDRREEGEER